MLLLRMLVVDKARITPLYLRPWVSMLILCSKSFYFFAGPFPGYHGEMLPTTANVDNHSLSHHDIARMFDHSNTGLSSVSRILFDSVPFNEPFTDYSTGFTEPTLHSSFACLEANNLDDSSRLQTFTSEALYTNHLSKEEADALSFTGIPSSEVFYYCLLTF